MGVLLVCCVCDVLLVAVVMTVLGGSVPFFKSKGSGMEGYLSCFSIIL